MLISSTYDYKKDIDEAIITLKVKGISAIFDKDTEQQIENLSYFMHSHFTNEVIRPELPSEEEKL